MPGRGFAIPRLDPRSGERIPNAGCGTGDHLMHPAGYGLPRLADQPRDEGSGQRTDEPSKGVEEHVMNGGGTIDWQHPLSQFDRERYRECKGRDPYDRSRLAAPQQGRKEADGQKQDHVGNCVVHIDTGYRVEL